MPTLVFCHLMYIKASRRVLDEKYWKSPPWRHNRFESTALYDNRVWEQTFGRDSSTTPADQLKKYNKISNHGNELVTVILYLLLTLSDGYEYFTVPHLRRANRKLREKHIMERGIHNYYMFMFTDDHLKWSILLGWWIMCPDLRRYLWKVYFFSILL